jgi:hypothetical protein
MARSSTPKGDYEGITAPVAAEDDNRNRAESVLSSGVRGGGEEERAGFVPLFVMTNCKDNSCRALGTHNGSPAGPDSIDSFTAVPPPD